MRQIMGTKQLCKIDKKKFGFFGEKKDTEHINFDITETIG